MRTLRCMLAIALVCGLTGMAKADPLDFQMVVLDPFSTTPIFTTQFTVVFAACSQGQLPTNVSQSYDGCFSAVNRSGLDWIGLEMVFSNTEALGSQPAGCALDGSTDYFHATQCFLATDRSRYILDFSAGDIPNNGSFVIAEKGVDPLLFPPGTATVTTTANPTPEPSSIWLLSTGVLVSGFFFTNRRRHTVGALRF